MSAQVSPPGAHRPGAAETGPRLRMIETAILAAVLLAAVSAASAPAALANEQERAAYRAAVERPGPQWIIISNHFKHSFRCFGGGCVLMGPTDDRAACEEWARDYNEGDPFDHARCVSAEPFLAESSGETR
ncbi:MAG: hypothetical protein AAFW46_16725 [Pseudomonadota bacterium]